MAFVQHSQVAWKVFIGPQAIYSHSVRSVAGLAMTAQAKAKNLETAQSLQRELNSSSSWSMHSMKYNTSYGAYEPWSEDMACILQGSCMPGSTRYCRTSSMFGKVNLFDIAQSSTVSQRASFHTYRPYVAKPFVDINRSFSLTGSNGSGPKNVHLWSEDIACILQGTCLPGSTKYCRTASMFGTLGMSDVVQGTSSRLYSTGGSAPEQDGGQVSLTQRQRLKLAVRDYGSTVIIFHVCISLMSLGGFYLAVSSGLDVQAMLKMLHFSEDIVSSKLAAGASTFVVAYAVHKVFAPVRIAITLTCTPFIVRYLRSVGVLKLKPKV